MSKVFLRIAVILALLSPLSLYAQSTVPQGGTGTTTIPANYVVLGNSALRVTAVATSSLGLESPLTFSTGLTRLGNNVTCNTANGSTFGCLSAADWTTFNNKQPAGNYLTAVSVASANGFAGSSSGGTTPALTISTSITGVLKGNGTAISAASNGVDFSLITANTCGAGQFFNSASAAGVFGCGTPASSGSGNVSTSSAETANDIPFWTTTNATPAKLSGGVLQFQWLPTISTLAITGSASTTLLSASGSVWFPNTAGVILSTSAAGLVQNTTVSSPLSFSGSTLSCPTCGTGTVTSVGAVYPLSSTGGTTPVISSATSSATSAGVLSAADWTTFNGKQAAGNYITALTGDGTASGPGSAAFTLATVNGNVGSFTNANVTANAKGQITAISNGTAPTTYTGTYPIVVTGSVISTPLATTTIQQTYGTPQIGQITLATTSVSFNGLTVADSISNSGGIFTITPLWSGTLNNTGLTNSTISGVALGGSLFAHTHDATLTGTSYNGSASVSDWGLNLANANTWTGIQTYTNGIVNNATSTGSKGFNISAGCYAIGGTCIGGGSSASSTLLIDNNTFSGTNNFTANLGVSTSTPWAKLSVDTSGTNPEFIVASSSDSFPSFFINKFGSVSIGTTTPWDPNNQALFAEGSSTVDYALTLNNNGCASLTNEDISFREKDIATGEILFSGACATNINGGAGSSEYINFNNAPIRFFLNNAAPAIFSMAPTLVNTKWGILFDTSNASTSLFTATSSVYLTNTSGAVLSTSASGLVQNTTISSPLAFSGSTLSLNTVPIASGGTGITTIGASSTVLTTDGTNSLWQKLDLGAAVYGTLPVANGGSGTATAFTQGSVVFAGSGGTYTQDNSGFFYDATNHRLGVGTTTPEKLLQVEGNISGGIVRVQRDVNPPVTGTFYGGQDFILNEQGGSSIDQVGPGITFGMRLNGGAITSLGDLSVLRSGADGTGILNLRSYVNGAVINGLQMGPYYGGYGSSNSASTFTVWKQYGGTSTNLFNIASSTSATNASSVSEFSVSTAGVITTQLGTGAVSSASGVLSTGTLSIANGGTNAASQTSNGVNFFNGTSITSGVNLVYNGTNFGVATATPWRVLSVNGTVALAGLTTSSAAQATTLCRAATNDIVADSLACASSARRYKQDINPDPLQNDLNDILSLQPVTYYFKPDFNGDLQKDANYSELQLGLIADDVISVRQQFGVVTTGTTTFEGKTYAAGTPQAVNYDSITAALVGAVKAQQQEIESLHPEKPLQSMEDNWQWGAIGFLLLWNLYLTFRKKRI